MNIQITDYPISLTLGYFDDERTSPQEILISLDLELFEQLGPGLSDELEQTIDYGEVFALMEQTIGGQEIKLIETVVETMGQAILEKFSTAKSVNVKVEKRALPAKLIKGARIKVYKKFSRS